MKRRYAAMILGLTLALTSVNLVCAADDATETTDTASDSTSSDTDASNDSAETTGTADAATEEDEIYGEVTAVDGSSITVNIGTLKEDAAVTEDSYGGSTETGSDTAESDSSATDDTTDSTTADDTSDNALQTIHRTAPIRRTRQIPEHHSLAARTRRQCWRSGRIVRRSQSQTPQYMKKILRL